MARKLRLEFPGAIYHVINRGNYRQFAFLSEGTKAAFVKCLFAACERSRWVLHAFVVMGNHYHLALETPQGNLVAGMQWLQATFANRFNRYRKEHGHLFQGRYKSLVVEEGEALGLLCHYIHLNPARAGMIGVEHLATYRYSSYWYGRRPGERPAFLRLDTALGEAGGLPDDRAGWTSYAAFLAWQMAEGPAGKSKAYVSMSKGWALGGTNFKRTLRADHAVATDIRAWETTGVREVRAAQWQEQLDRLLARLSPQEREDCRKGAPWKVRVAQEMKMTSDAPNGWLAAALVMGSPRYLAKLVCLAGRR